MFERLRNYLPGDPFAGRHRAPRPLLSGVIKAAAAFIVTGAATAAVIGFTPLAAHAATTPWDGRHHPGIWTSEDAPLCSAPLAGRLALLRIDDYGPASMLRCEHTDGAWVWVDVPSRPVSAAVRAELRIPPAGHAFARMHAGATSVIVWAATTSSPVHVVRS